MQTKWTCYAAALFVVLAFSLPAQAGKWKEAKSDKYGFSMQVPKGTVLAGKEWKGGWGGLYGNFFGVQLWGIAHLGKKHTPAQIEAFGLWVTKIPPKKWIKIDEGQNQNGWEWYKTWKAEVGKHTVLGAYGVGPRGSYLLVLKTKTKSFQRDRAAYLRWTNSLKVF